MSKQQDIPQSDNELIAEFMGLFFEHESGKWMIFVKDLPREYKCFEVGFAPEDLRYDTSWDWLMPVVEKINAIEIIAEPRGENLQEAVRKYVGMVQIKDAHMYVVNFIQWYNLNQQTPKP